MRAFKVKARSVQRHPDPQTVALSIGDATASPISLSTIYESRGSAEAVSEEESSPRCGYWPLRASPPNPRPRPPGRRMALQRRGEIGSDEDVVRVMTGAAAKWPDSVCLGITPHELHDEDSSTVRSWLEATDRNVRRNIATMSTIALNYDHEAWLDFSGNRSRTNSPRKNTSSRIGLPGRS